MPALDGVNTISKGFAGTIEGIGLVIIFGNILGKYLEKTNSTNKMAFDMVRLCGEKRSSLAMALTGYVVSIPVFSDAAMVLLSPLIRALARKSNRPKVELAVLGVSLATGLLSTNVFFPPTPGPLAAAGMLGIDIGWAMLFGGFVALVRTLFGWFYAHFFLAHRPESFYTYEESFDDEATPSQEDLPGTMVSLAPLLIPLILILMNTASTMMLPKNSSVVKVTSFVGNATVALVIGVIVAIVLHLKKLGSKEALKLLNDGVGESGSIVFIVAIGGALGSVLKASGVGDSLATAISTSGLPAILVPFAIGAVIKLINGSGTTSLITAVTICTPFIETLSMNPVLIFLSAYAFVATSTIASSRFIREGLVWT